MSERVSLGAAGKQPGVSGGGIRRAGYTKVTAGRLGAWEHEPPAWLRKARARRRRPRRRRAEVSCCVCGTMREVRPRLVQDYTHLDGYVRRIAAAGERASVRRAAALARAAFLNAPGQPES
jgi:hypothetical protein